MASKIWRTFPKSCAETALLRTALGWWPSLPCTQMAVLPSLLRGWHSYELPALLASSGYKEQVMGGKKKKKSSVAKEKLNICVRRALRAGNGTPHCYLPGCQSCELSPLDLLLHGHLPGLPAPICPPCWGGPAGLTPAEVACHWPRLCLQTACQRQWIANMMPQRWSCCHRVPGKVSQPTGGSSAESGLCPGAVHLCKGGTGPAPLTQGPPVSNGTLSLCFPAWQNRRVMLR